MDTATILIIFGIIIIITVCLTLYCNWRWQEKVKRFVAGLIGYFFGIVSGLGIVLILWWVLG